MPRYRTFLADVVRTRHLGPSFVRVTFSGEPLREFGAAGHDQRIKLLLPQPGRTVTDIPQGTDWYTMWQRMPDAVRPIMRTYTVRAYRPGSAELDVDFVLHGTENGHGGPASTWSATARPGDRVGLVGPDRPGRGRMWGCEWALPPTARQVLLAGDETAVPAVGSIVESLPRDIRGIVCLEVPTPDDIASWTAPAGVTVRWSVRQQHSMGSRLETSVARALGELCGQCPARGTECAISGEVDVEPELLWEVPESQAAVQPSHLYGWLAGEAGVIKSLRRMLVRDFGVPRSSVSFMGYWRRQP